MGRGRAPCCDKNNVKKGPWSPSEDSRLMEFITMHGHTNWRALPKLAGLKRCGKSCRLRWINYLRPDVRRGNFSPQEELTIINLHNSFGNKWSKIASYLPGRTDNEIKNVWNTHLKKRLTNPNLVHHHHHSHETHEPKQSSTTNYSASLSSTSTNSTTSPLGVALKNPNLKPYDHDHPTSDSPTSSSFSAMHPAPDDGKIEIPVDSDINIWELFESLEDHENTTETNEVDEQVWKVECSKWIGLLEDELGLTSDANQTLLKDQNMNSPLEPEIIGPGFDYFPLWPSSPQNL